MAAIDVSVSKELLPNLLSSQAARVKVVVASVMQPTVVCRDLPNASL